MKIVPSHYRASLFPRLFSVFPACFCLLCAACFTVVSEVRAANYDVINGDDSGAGSLWEAMDSLSTDGDTITFGPETFLSYMGVIYLDSVLPTIEVDMDFNGPRYSVGVQKSGLSLTPLLSVADDVEITGLDTFQSLRTWQSAPVLRGDGRLIISGQRLPGVIISDGSQVVGGIKADTLIINDGFSGGILSTGGEEYSYGILTDDAVIVNGDLGGRIDVNSNGEGSGYAIKAGGDLTVLGDVSGEINGVGGLGTGYGLYSDHDITISGDVSGEVSAGNRSSYYGGGYAIYAEGSVIIEDGVSGTISSESHASYGIANNTTIGGIVRIKNGISGTIIAKKWYLSEETSNTASAIDASNLNISGGISGSLSARAGTTAYGLLSYSDVELSGGISGLITAEATKVGSESYGIQAENNMSIYDGISGAISSQAGGAARGLWSVVGAITIDGGISGSVSASAGGNIAHAISSKEGVSILGDVAGPVSASCSGDSARGIYSSGNIVIAGDISNTVQATATGEGAKAIFSVGQLSLEGGISGAVVSSAGYFDSYGLSGRNGVTLSGGISGRISSEVTKSYNANYGGERAYGIYSKEGNLDITGGIGGTVASSALGRSYGLSGYNGVAISGGISGQISAETTTGDRAYGIYSEDGNLSIADGISGRVAASAGTHTALGLAAPRGSLNGGTSETALDISGEVSSQAQGLAVAVSSGSGMNVAVSGSLSGTDSSGGEGYAIRSGRDDDSGGWVDTAAVDNITLFEGANITGKVDLAGGNDILTFTGAVTTDNVLSGGDGTDTLGLVGTETTTFHGDVREFELLNKSGSGTWIMSGDMDVLHTTTVSAGMLKVQDTLTSATINLSRGATLGGTGRIVGNVDNLGILAPGNSPGTLTIQGDYIHHAGATLDMEITPTTSDLLVVTGSADLQGGTLAMTLEPGYYQTGKSYTLLSTGSGINGEFSEVEDNSPFLQVDISQDGEVLSGVISRSYADAATSWNGRQAGLALTTATLDPSPAMQEIITALDFMPVSAASQGLDQLDPEPFDAFSQVTFSIMQMFSDEAWDRLYAVRMGGGQPLAGVNYDDTSKLPQLAASGDLSAIGPIGSIGLDSNTESSEPRFGLYLKPLGVFETYEESGNRTGYSSQTIGAVGGVDMRFYDNCFLGLQLGYAHSDLDYSDSTASQAQSDHLLAGVYGSYFNGGFYGDVVIQSGVSFNNMERNIEFAGFDQNAKSDFTSFEYGGGLKLGYDFGKKIKVGPVGSIDYAFVSNPKFSETGASALDLEVKGNTAESLKSTLGVHASAQLAMTEELVLAPDFSITWGHEFLNDSRTIEAGFDVIPNTGFTARTGNPSRDSMLVGAGLTLSIKAHSKFFARYTGEFLANDSQAHGVAVGFRYEF